jgi:phospholipid/cholesterol/gamma-HCH transport system substrate-binding protein
MTQLQATTANLRQLSEQLKNPDSSLGLLMNDPALYNNLNNTVNSLDSLFIDIKAHPKRYINIKLL